MCVCTQGLSPFGLLYYNALVALPVSILVAYAMGEVADLASFPYLNDPVRPHPVSVPMP